MDWKRIIRVVPEFKGVTFIDITTLMKDGPAFCAALNALAEPYKAENIDLVIGPEARGFAVGAPLAYILGVGFVPVRKPGKLPAETIRHEYSLEYGKDMLEVHKDAIAPGQRVLIADDLLATGGTTQATVRLIEELGGQVAGIAFLIELTFLKGRDRLSGYPIRSLVQY
ncbi:MAG TPA: adenine phosphoribosyltransferase [Selenomonadales bacterium]|nr:adenine phosphoribosyltransferase [Selenomonadales bacterium]